MNNNSKKFRTLGVVDKDPGCKNKVAKEVATALKGSLPPVVHSSVLGFVTMLGMLEMTGIPHTLHPQQKNKREGVGVGWGIALPKDTNKETRLKLPWP